MKTISIDRYAQSFQQCSARIIIVVHDTNSTGDNGTASFFFCVACRVVRDIVNGHRDKFESENLRDNRVRGEFQALDNGIVDFGENVRGG